MGFFCLFIGLALLLILYAGMLRYNALFAVLPILFVLLSLLIKRFPVWSGLACVIGGLLVTIGVTAVINQPSEKLIQSLPYSLTI